jgi:phospholipase/carboxylesterase
MTNPSDLSRPHVYKPGSSQPLILLHGTGADEHDLIPLGELLSPGATLLSPRGMSQAEGVNRFFERRPDGSFVQESLVKAIAELAEFFEAAGKEYSLELSKAYAVGFSNGGNTALAILMTHPESIAGVVAFGTTDPMPQLTKLPDLSGKRVFIANGTQDHYAPSQVTQDLIAKLTKAGA